MPQDNNPIEEGRWTSASWKFFISDIVPDEHSVTAVFGVPIHSDGLALTCNHRGWELPGGHREVDESVRETLAREVLEEAGISEFRSYEKPLGYLEIMDDAPRLNKATGEPYPDPSYIVFYAVRVNTPLGKPTDRETIDCRIFPFESLPEIKGETARRTISHLLKEARRVLNCN